MGLDPINLHHVDASAEHEDEQGEQLHKLADLNDCLYDQVDILGCAVEEAHPEEQLDPHEHACKTRNDSHPVHVHLYLILQEDHDQACQTAKQSRHVDKI